MVTLERRTLENCVSDLNDILTRGAAAKRRPVVLDDVPRWEHHFAQWLNLRRGGQPTSPPSSATPFSPDQFLLAIILLEDHGGSLALHPPAMRRNEIAGYGEQLGLAPQELHDVWAWWDTMGKRFALSVVEDAT